TGRKPPKRFIDAADYVTEFKKHKHPYDRGIQARKGIEY
nr:cob(I)yrinic acid a,c-diamide adenosyltransferase [Ruminococcus sp.]